MPLGCNQLFTFVLMTIYKDIVLVFFLQSDDTDWESIETQISVTQPVARIASTLRQESRVPEWPELMAKVTTLGGMVPFEVKVFPWSGSLLFCEACLVLL